MADNEGSMSKSNIPELDNTNFLHWLMQMKAHLQHKGLIKYITEAPVELSGAAADAVNKKHTETVNILMNYMSETAFEAVVIPDNKKSPFKIWSSITLCPSATLTKIQEIVHLKELCKNFSGMTSKALEKTRKGRRKDVEDRIVLLGNTIARQQATMPNTVGSYTPNNFQTPQNHQWGPINQPLSYKPAVLDSGATHHLINNPDMFHPTADYNIKISMGGHSNFLNATAVGSALLINHTRTNQ
ncbi:uncharacterized protein VP01_5385g1 [Puccinia sorghi]|uniref:Uncharacterized protein n=1 Tax=Puccinia sorghi TaxID=27349 RepID=A0A0L6UJY8_9BASI|nr:uncharacterized protein VP01_5385g1 [Puccinia sorghi]